ncbi:Von Willebrand factor type A domain protein [Labilithrix luteola]|uniref:von Willebrand factor type A domain protein n=1 Tax=Labilithrix luteola TaxID=1391654 RepID=A0A0K1PKV9_9BACT|nr:von Willebrand factor type A domain-containing protein [Labilithrix luteola]AKU94036.1 Von Willebrand factor type A domain protein [Labilithrix luteola]
MALPRASFLFLALPFALVACSSNDSSTSAYDAMGSSNASPPSANAGSTAPVVSGAPPTDGVSGETYGDTKENDFVDTVTQSTSTFAVDVDTGSYSLMRRDLVAGHLPAQAGVRPEEYVNYFKYAYPQPENGQPFAVQVDGAPSLFGEGLHLLRVGLQGKVIQDANRKPANLVFLVDVSGSMADPNKLPLVQYALKQLVKRLEATDTLSIVTYAGFESVLVPPTPVTNKSAILDAIDGLTAGGSTNGEGGIRKAYELAEQAKQPDSINRVVLCTDGDFNVGATGDALIQLIEQERDKGVTLTTLGFGAGNYNDRDMEALADHGNGNYAYIDGPGEANRVLGEKLVSTLQVIAKDVKVQVEFKPQLVTRYRLVGYENRVMSNEDFRNDGKDAGEIGAGHSVTAFYEVQLAPNAQAVSGNDGTLATVRLRYKQPDGDVATEFERPLLAGGLAPTFAEASPDFRFAAAVTEFSEILRHSKHSEGARFDDVLGLVNATSGGATDRQELGALVSTAKSIWK